MTEHNFKVTAQDETTRTWKCSCGFWCTVETKHAPDYHTPMAQRKAEHLAQVEAIASGTAWLDLPADYQYKIFHRKSWLAGQPGQIVLWAWWPGGHRELNTWPCTGEGLTWHSDDKRRVIMPGTFGGIEQVTAADIERRTQNWM